MHDRSRPAHEPKKKKKDTKIAPALTTVVKEIVPQPEVIKKHRKEKEKE